VSSVIDIANALGAAKEAYVTAFAKSLNEYGTLQQDAQVKASEIMKTVEHPRFIKAKVPDFEESAKKSAQTFLNQFKYHDPEKPLLIKNDQEASPHFNSTSMVRKQVEQFFTEFMKASEARATEPLRKVFEDKKGKMLDLLTERMPAINQDIPAQPLMNFLS